MSKSRKNRAGKIEASVAILPNTLKKLGLTTKYKHQLLLNKWEELVGKEMARHILPQKIEFKKLFVYIHSPIWANNFQYIKMEIIEKINSYLGGVYIKEIVFSRYKNKLVKGKVIKASERNLGAVVRKVVLTEAEIAKVEKATSKISNEELRKKIAKVYIRNLQLEKLKRQYEWHPCEECGRLVPKKEVLCVVCERKAYEEREIELREVFKVMPWARFQDIEEYIDCDKEEFNRIKDRIIQAWASKLKPGEDYPDRRVNSKCGYSIECKAVVMMYRSIPEAQLTEAILKSTIKELKYNTAYWEVVGKLNKEKKEKDI